MNQALLNWLASGDTGLSSRSILAHMEHDLSVYAMNRNEVHYPRDPADLGRCIRLMDIEPSFRVRIAEMGRYGPEWKALTEHWSELESLYCKNEDSGKAPECYLLMVELNHGKKIADEVREGMAMRRQREIQDGDI